VHFDRHTIKAPPEGLVFDVHSPNLVRESQATRDFERRRKATGGAWVEDVMRYKGEDMTASERTGGSDDFASGGRGRKLKAVRGKQTRLAGQCQWHVAVGGVGGTSTGTRKRCGFHEAARSSLSP